jgi:hypothetical protein
VLQFFLISTLVFAQDVAPEEAPTEDETPTEQGIEEVDLLRMGSTEDVDAEAPAEEPAVAPAITEDMLHRLEAAAFYKVGLELVGEGRYDEASVLFEKLIGTYGDTDIAPRAQEQWSNLELLQSGGVDDLVVQAKAYEEKGWAELAINQGIAMPVIMGFLIPAGTTQPEEPAIPVSMGMLGLGVGVGGAYLLDKHYELDRGHAMAVFTGEWMGLLNGYMASAITEPRDYRGHYRYMLMGTLLGGGAGALAGHYLDISSGDMALINTGGLWGGILGLSSFVFVPPEDDQGGIIRTVAAMDLGMAIAAAIGTKWKLSRKRMAVINMSSVAGAGLGLGFGFFGVYYGDLEEEGFTLLMLASSGLGALAGGYLSRDTEGTSAVGSVLNLNEGKWALGAPMPSPIVGPDGSVGMGLSLANGRF